MARLILAPAQGEAAYQKAAEAFQELYQKITGNLLPVAIEDDNCSDLVVIGSDAVNDFAMDAMLREKSTTWASVTAPTITASVPAA